MITSRLFGSHCSFLKNYSYFSFDPKEVSVVPTANISTNHHSHIIKLIASNSSQMQAFSYWLLALFCCKQKVSYFDFVPAPNNSTIDFLTKSLMIVQNIVFSVKNNIFTVEEGAKSNLRLSIWWKMWVKSESLMDAVICLTICCRRNKALWKLGRFFIQEAALQTF